MTAMSTPWHLLFGRRAAPNELAASVSPTAQLDGYAKRDLERELGTAGLSHSQARLAVSVFARWQSLK